MKLAFCGTEVSETVVGAVKPHSAGTDSTKPQVGAVESVFGGTEVSGTAVGAVKPHSAGTNRPKP